VARAARRTGLTLPLLTLVALSTLLHWLAARRVMGLWIMPDEAIYGVRALGLWEHGKLPLFGSSGAGYSALYPIVVGAPLSIGSLSTGLALVKPLQALLMSLAAWPVYAYTRRRNGERSALVASALTVAVPLVLYSSSLMTETLYYPAAAAALLATVRALELATLRAQAFALALIAIAVTIRVQGGVLLLAFALAILIQSGVRRERPPLRAFWPVWTLTIGAIVVAAAAPGAFGAYASALTGTYPLAAAARLVYYHLAYLIVMVAVLPVAALVLLATDAARTRDRESTALVSVAISATAVTVLQVGVFSSRFAPHLLGRDLAALPPILFCVLATWFARGAPRPRVATSATVLATLAVVVLAPWDKLVGWDAFPDSLDIALLFQRPVGWTAATLVTVAAATLLVLLRFAPQRTVLSLLLLALFAWNSVRASHLVDAYAAGTQTVLTGDPYTWIDRTAQDGVVYVYNGDLASWPVVWEQRFWNPRIDLVLSIRPYRVPGPIEQREIALPRNGFLPVGERYAVANDRISFVGDAVARQDRGPDQYPLVLWRLDARPRISTVIAGVQPNGDMTGAATVRAFGCAGGSLELTLLPKATREVEVRLDGRIVARAAVEGLPVWHASIAVPARHAATCGFTIRGGALLGSTRIAFLRRS
jgi:hypothetical protein